MFSLNLLRFRWDPSHETLVVSLFPVRRSGTVCRTLTRLSETLGWDPGALTRCSNTSTCAHETLLWDPGALTRRSNTPTLFPRDPPVRPSHGNPLLWVRCDRMHYVCWSTSHGVSALSFLFSKHKPFYPLFFVLPIFIFKYKSISTFLRHLYSTIFSIDLTRGCLYHPTTLHTSHDSLNSIDSPTHRLTRLPQFIRLTDSQRLTSTHPIYSTHRLTDSLYSQRLTRIIFSSLHSKLFTSFLSQLFYFHFILNIFWMKYTPS